MRFTKRPASYPGAPGGDGDEPEAHPPARHGGPSRGARVRKVAGVVVVVAVAVVAGRAALDDPELPSFVADGDAVDLPAAGVLPAVSLGQFEGMLVGLRGQPVVVNIWASWCAPCRTEMPLLQNAAEAFEGRATILGVASNDDPQSAAEFLEDIEATYPNVFDPSGEIRVALGLTAYPTTYVFDRDGSIRARVDGGISEQRLAGLIEDALR